MSVSEEGFELFALEDDGRATWTTVGQRGTVHPCLMSVWERFCARYGL